MFELGERGAERCSRRDLEATADKKSDQEKGR
jgi:hypothetical protein